MGRWRALIPIGLALVIAVFGSVFIYSWMQQQAVPERIVQEVQKERPELVNVVVASTDLAAGSRLQRDFLTMTEQVKKNLPQGHFLDRGALEGRILLAPVQRNEPIIEHRLAPVDVRTGGVSALIPEGKRAVAIGGDKVIGISGFIHPGNRVDVMVTWENPDDGDQITKRVLENIPVLATGTMMQETEKGTTSPVDVYTLEVTPEEAEILTHGRNQGRIQLALRSPKDSEPVLTRGATTRVAMEHMHQLAGQSRAMPSPEPEMVARAEPEVSGNPSPRPEIVVEVIQSGRLVEKTFAQ